MISEGYKKLLLQKHEEDPSWATTGGGGVYISLIEKAKILVKNDCSILDFGCGKGALKKAYDKNKAILPSYKKWIEYDPGIPGKDVLPNSFVDLTLCFDVLEHIEEDRVTETLRYLDKISGTVVLSIACTPAKDFLPDGRNAHLTIIPPQQWLAVLSERWDLQYAEIIGTYRINFIGWRYV